MMPENKFNWRAMDKDYVKMAQLYTADSREHNDELFKKLLVNDFPIDYKIPQINSCYNWLTSKTLFQITISNELRQFLIEHGADYTVTNREGSTVLHEQAILKYGKYSSRFEFRQLQEDELVAHIVLSAHIKSGNAKNPKDQNGLTYFHVACMYDHINGVNFFLNNGTFINETVNRDSTFCPGYSALHFAVKMRAVEIVELLLKSDADIFVEDVKGRNPLQVLIAERIKIFIELKKFSRRNQLIYPKLQDYLKKNKVMIGLFMKNIEERSPRFFDNSAFSLIHLICTDETKQVKQFIDCNEESFAQLIHAGSQVFAGFTPVHFAALFSVDTLILLMEKGATLATQDANKVTPFDMCLQGLSAVDMHRILTSHPDYSNIVFSDRKTKLSDFIYEMREAATFEIFLQNHLTNVNMFIPFDSPVAAGYTPLHLAVICNKQPVNWNWKSQHSTHGAAYENLESEESQKYLARIDSLLNYNVDIACRDAQGSTALHWAFRLQESHVVDRLLQRHESSSSYVNEDGLSHLHIACAASDGDLVEKLIRGGADVNQVAAPLYTWIDVQGTRIYGDKRFFISKGSTPLHFATAVQCPIAVEILVNHGADVLAKDAEGLNPLESMLGMSIFDDGKVHERKAISMSYNERGQIVGLLVRLIGTKLVDERPDQMMHCFSLLDNHLMANICEYSDDALVRIFENWGITTLHVACFIRNFLLVPVLAAEIDVNARVNLESPLWLGCTPLHLFTKYRFRDGFDDGPNNMAIARALLERGADVAARDGNGETPIHQMFEYYRRQIDWHFRREPHFTIGYLDLMLTNLGDFVVNSSDREGFTHLHIASLLGKVSVVEKLLEQGAEIDQPTDYLVKDYGGFTALHFAAFNQQKDMVDFLLRHGADVNWRNTRDESALHLATREYRRGQCLDLLQTLVSAGADIHAKNMLEETSFESLIKSRDVAKEEIEFCLENGCRVNTVNPFDGDSFLAKALKSQRMVPIFEAVFHAPDMKDIDDNGRNAIHNIVTLNRPSWDTFAFSSIDDVYPPSDEYAKGIGSLIKLGLNIDHQDRQGMTPLHIAAKRQNITGIIGLLENGADVNITDADGKPAFYYSLELADFDEDPSDLDEDLDLGILNVIATQFFKLNLASIGVSEANRKIENKIREKYSFDLDTDEVYDDEVERMLEQQITSTSITLYQWLSDTGPVSAFPHMQPSDREAIVHYFENEIDNLRGHFPAFAGVLLLQFRKALARRDMIDAAVISLDLLIGSPMPAVCSTIIFRYLSNYDLHNLNSASAILDE